MCLDAGGESAGWEVEDHVPRLQSSQQMILLPAWESKARICCQSKTHVHPSEVIRPVIPRCQLQTGAAAGVSVTSSAKPFGLKARFI